MGTNIRQCRREKDARVCLYYMDERMKVASEKVMSFEKIKT